MYEDKILVHNSARFIVRLFPILNPHPPMQCCIVSVFGIKSRMFSTCPITTLVRGEGGIELFMMFNFERRMVYRTNSVPECILSIIVY
jgi:hypothetical protein